MVARKNVWVIVLTALCLAAIILAAVPVSSVPSYDPWLDINDDGNVDIKDYYAVGKGYGGFYDPLPLPFNKTEMILKMYTDPFISGLLLTLPYGATQPWRQSQYCVDYTCILYSLDLDQSTPGNQQSIFVYKDATITVTGEYERYQGSGGTGAILQALLIYSWTPTWPAPNSTYYQGMYNGSPGPYPGTGKQSFSFDLTVPSKGGTYYLYWCYGAEYSMEDAVARYDRPLYVPYAVIVVGE